MLKDYSERSYKEVVRELQTMNPKAHVVMNADMDGIVTDRPALRLFLPRDFYVTRNGSLCNRGHTESGNYLLLSVKVLNAEKYQQPKLRFLNRFFQNKSVLKESATQTTATDREM